MANQKHLRQIRSGSAKWNRWREEHSTESIDLSEADLNNQVVYVLQEIREDSTKSYKVVGYVYGLPFRANNKIIKEVLQAELLGKVNRQ